MRKFPFIRLPKIDGRKLLCLLGFHVWVYANFANRRCIHCRRREELDEQEQNEASPIWMKVD